MLKPDIQSFFDAATSTFSYVVWSEESRNKNCAIIDPVLDYDIYSSRSSTDSADKIIKFIKEKNLVVEWILETHIHADHLSAANYLKEKLGGKIAISNHITKILKTWQEIFYGKIDTSLSIRACPKSTPFEFASGFLPHFSVNFGSFLRKFFQNSCIFFKNFHKNRSKFPQKLKQKDLGQALKQFDHLFADDEIFKIGDLEAKILYTPGHTPSDTSYVIGDAIFVGDAMFLPDVGSGRCDFPGGSAEDSFDSSRKILSFPDSYKIYVGHDYPPNNSRAVKCFATVAEQKAKNIRFSGGISKDEFVKKRKKDDVGKAVPKLLLPAIQVNLRAGSFGEKIKGVQYIKLPLNRI